MEAKIFEVYKQYNKIYNAKKMTCHVYKIPEKVPVDYEMLYGDEGKVIILEDYPGVNNKDACIVMPNNWYKDTYGDPFQKYVVDDVNKIKSTCEESSEEFLFYAFRVFMTYCDGKFEVGSEFESNAAYVENFAEYSHNFMQKQLSLKDALHEMQSYAYLFQLHCETIDHNEEYRIRRGQRFLTKWNWYVSLLAKKLADEMYAATKVRALQRAWRNAITDPGHPVCQNRLIREYSTLRC